MTHLNDDTHDALAVFVDGVALPFFSFQNYMELPIATNNCSHVLSAQATRDLLGWANKLFRPPADQPIVHIQRSPVINTVNCFANLTCL